MKDLEFFYVRWLFCEALAQVAVAVVVVVCEQVVVEVVLKLNLYAGCSFCTVCSVQGRVSGRVLGV